MLLKYRQDTKAVRVRTALPDDVLLLDSISGTEGLSRPFVFQVNLLSERRDIDPAELLRTPMAVWFDLENEKPAWDDEEERWIYEGGRWIHGLVRSFTQMGNDDDLYAYRAEIVPWIWFLSLEKNCRIFQRKREEEGDSQEEQERNSVIEIVERVFKEYEASCEHAVFENKCSLEYPERDYCVQYRESNLNFISRLLEEEGIYYYFEHSEDGHRLVLLDDIWTLPVCEGQPQVGMDRESGREDRGREDREGAVKSLEREYTVHSGMVTLADYNYLTPDAKLCPNALSADEEEGAGAIEEIYDYPGGFDERYVEDGSDEEPDATPILQRGEHLARIGIERAEASHKLVRGAGDCRAFYSGSCFHLVGHGNDDVNREYALVEVRHEAKAGTYRTGRLSRGEKPTYSNTFVAMPKDSPYRPPLRATKPLIHGSQTAQVVGPSDEEIYVDKHGRIKVQFHWDRLGQKNAGSSCWLRVSTPWAGTSWGAIRTPRIGQEVVVSFLEGDPDRPLVTGSVYNAAEPPPWPLPEEKTRSGVKSRSSKGGDGYNEISLEDKKGGEQIRIHAEKDMSTTVKNDQTTTVGNDQTTTVKNDQKTTVKNDKKDTVEGRQTINVTKDQAAIIEEGSRSISVKKGSITEVAKKFIYLQSSDENVDFVAKTHLIATAQEGLAELIAVNSNAKLEGGKKVRVFSGGGPIEVEAETKADITAGDQIELVVGEAKITITKDNITLTGGGSTVELSKNGINISAAGGKDVQVSGMSVKLNC